MNSMQNITLESFPNEIHFQVLMHIEAKDLNCLICVSKAFESIVDSYRVQATNSGKRLKDLGAINLIAFVIQHNLIKLNLLGCDQITDGGLAHIGNLPNLQQLNLAGCGKIMDSGLAHIGNLPNLQQLDLR